MKGFYIEVTNNLLEPKHREAMGESVWLFMWLLDHITSITEDGAGIILGGKPIKYTDVEPELGISDRTYTRWISNLRKHGYIETKRTPYGIILSVNKAKKRFGQKSDTPKVAEPVPPKMAQRTDKLADVIKTSQSQDNKILLQPAEPVAPIKPKEKSEHAQLVEIFYDTCQRARGMKPKITGADGMNLKRALQVMQFQELMQLTIYFLGSHRYKQFAPSISTMLSSGILNGLMNKARNDEEFWREMDGLMLRYGRGPAQGTRSEMAKKLDALTSQILNRMKVPA